MAHLKFRLVRKFYGKMISLRGYPRTSLRTYSLIGEYTKWIDRIFGTVEQKKSLGKTWIKDHEYAPEAYGLWLMANGADYLGSWRF